MGLVAAGKLDIMHDVQKDPPMAATPLKRTIAYVEDDARFRFHFAQWLAPFDAAGRIRTFASAESFLTEVETCRDSNQALPWDLVFMDLGLPGLGGAEAIATLKDAYPKTLILALTVFEDPAQILAAISAGADGYLLKTTPPETLLRDIDHALRHGSGFSPALADAILDLVRKGAARTVKPEASPLSKRQIEVLKGLSEGDSYRVIAENYNISLDTVRSHVRHIYSYLHVNTAREAVSKALKKKII